MLSLEARQDLLRRLRKIEGQTQGIQRMVEEGRECVDILNQLASVRAATRRVSMELMRYHLMACLSKPDCLNSEQVVDDMLNLLTRA
ncbi:MAG: metal-sensitive transcriptional regulator [Chloroflexi bacterium]|nr:metal-sensitive transcriptional regulator [Chloroflexota bacterium]